MACVALACVALLGACSGEKKPAAASQVAVKVNDGDVSVHQVDGQLSRMQGIQPAQADAARKQIVESLIDQKLLMDRAIDNKLDRDPDVLASVEQSRMQILAQAYLQKTLAARARPSEAEVKAYYAENPALFSERRVYRLQELATNIGTDRVDELKKVVASAKSLNEVGAWLQKNQFQVAGNAAVRSAEQLPLQQLAEISRLKDGEMAVFPSNGRVAVLQVVASQSQPVDEARATPLIEQFLGTRKRDELARAEVKHLRETAKIEYVGDFAKLADMKMPDAAPVAAAASDVSAVSAPASAVDRGVAGLR
jgi:EpsD family peptidyl-prolyl cis-trans isomerase